MTGIILLIALSLSIIGMFSFFSMAPQIGGKPDGDRLKRMMSSNNYRGGKFHNTVSTKMEMKSANMFGVMWEFIRGNKNREPSETLMVNRFNPEVFAKTNAGGITFTWFGHSSLLLKADDKILLIDPIFSERASMFSFLGPKRFPYTHYMDIESLPEVDAVLISHDHYDHLDYKTIKELSKKVSRFYVPLSVGVHLEEWGVPSENIIELDWWESVSFGNLNLTFTPSRHFSGRGLNNRYSTLWGSWVIRTPDQSVFFGGDSGYFPGFREIGEKYGPFDVTFLECGAYNENWSEIHMMPEETVKAHIDLKGKYLVPIHWGKFSLALHPWKEPVERAAARSDELNVKMLTPEIGRIVEINGELNSNYWWEKYK